MTQPTMDQDEDYITYEPNTKEYNRPIISNNSVMSESEDEEPVYKVEDTTNPNIKRITKGAIYRYKVSYKRITDNRTYSNILDTFSEAEQYYERMTDER